MSDKFEFIDAEYAAYQESGERYVPSIVKPAGLALLRARIPPGRQAI